MQSEGFVFEIIYEIIFSQITEAKMFCFDQFIKQEKKKRETEKEVDLERLRDKLKIRGERWIHGFFLLLNILNTFSNRQFVHVH